MNLLFECSPFAPRHAASEGWRPVRHEWFQIRPFSDQDLYPCLMLWARASWRAHRFLGLTPWLRQGWRLWKGQLQKASTWVYVQQGVVRGFVSVHPENHVAGLFVSPSHQGRGIGGRLLEHAGQVFDLGSVDVYALNSKARRFYEKHGFSVFSTCDTDADGERYMLLRMRRAVSPPGPSTKALEG